MGIGRTPRSNASLSKRMSVNPIQMAAVDAKFKTAEELQAAAAPGTETEAKVRGCLAAAGCWDGGKRLLHRRWFREVGAGGVARSLCRHGGCLK